MVGWSEAIAVYWVNYVGSRMIFVCDLGGFRVVFLA